MLFVQSLRGLSHTKLEDTREEHLELSVAALDRLASKTIAWVATAAVAGPPAVEPSPDDIDDRRVAGLAVGGCLTWNVSNVGAVADPLAEHYGVSLAAVGLLTTALFVTHLAVQLPAGGRADRLRLERIARRSRSLAVVAAVTRSSCSSTPGSAGARRPGRRRHRLGRGVRRRARPRARGRWRRVAAGRLRRRDHGRRRARADGRAAAHRRDGWRAPYWSAALLALLAPSRRSRPTRPSASRAMRGRVACSATGGCCPLGVLQAATFGLAVVAGNWVVPLLERQGAARRRAGLAGGLVLFAGIVTRPVGGLARRARDAGRHRSSPQRSCGTSLRRVSCSRSADRSRCRRSARSSLGLVGRSPVRRRSSPPHSGVRPDAPAAAIALVNGCAVLDDPRRHTARRPRIRASERRPTRVRQRSACSERRPL